MEKIYEKYNVKNFGELVQYFEMRTSVSIEDLNVDDATIYHGPTLILDKVKEQEYSPLEEQILLYTTFLSAFYGFEYQMLGELIEILGSFRFYYLFKQVLLENDFFKEFVKLYENYTERLNNLGIILVKEGKELINKVEEFISGISPETISKLIEEVNEKLLATGILEELGVDKN